MKLSELSLDDQKRYVATYALTSEVEALQAQLKQEQGKANPNKQTVLGLTLSIMEKSAKLTRDADKLMKEFGDVELS